MSDIQVKTMAEMVGAGMEPEVLFWVGCAGSFDDKAKSVTKAFVKILHNAQISFAVLGSEEGCSGDPAKRAGNEFLFQMQAMQNIQTMNAYGVKKVVATCPHCFNTLKNEYPELGGQYEVLHHTQFLQKLIDEGRLKIEGGAFQGKKITYHDACYLGRGNNEYEAPRSLIEKLDAALVEMPRNKKNGFCCGAGGAQMFKEAEKGSKEVNVERSEEAIAQNPEVIAVGCPFCKTMMADGVKHFEKEDQIQVLDLAELIAQAKEL